MLNYVDIGRKIKFYRNKNGLRQSDVAEMLDVSVSYISQIERGTMDVSLKRLDEISSLISAPVSALLSDSNESNTSYLHFEFAEKIADWDSKKKRLLLSIIDAIDKTY